MNNIKYKLDLVSERLFVEVKLTGSIRKNTWNLFIDEIIKESDAPKSIYMLIDENQQVNEIDYDTVQKLIATMLKEHFDEIILSFVTTDTFKVCLQRLFYNMSQIANVPLKVTFHSSIKDAETLIKNSCRKCKSTMFPK